MNEFAFAALGLVILLFAGDLLVRGAVNLALRLGIPALIVSLTIVAFGTSAPELLIGVKSVLGGAPGIAIGNVVGSNTANILLVLGVPALIAGLPASGTDTRKTFNIMIASTVLFIGLCFFGPLTWWHGLVLLGGLAFVLSDAFRAALSHRRDGADEENDIEGVDNEMPGWKIGAFLALGLIGLPIGAHLLVENATLIAREFGVSETVIGLTLVAIGTSLPELATTVMAALRREADVALGNVIGSNMFNLLAIMGVSSLVGPIPVPKEFLTFDLWVMLACSLLLAPIVYRNLRLGYRWGFFLSGAYIAYLVGILALEV